VDFVRSLLPLGSGFLKSLRKYSVRKDAENLTGRETIKSIDKKMEFPVPLSNKHYNILKDFERRKFNNFHTRLCLSSTEHEALVLRWSKNAMWESWLYVSELELIERIGGNE